MACPGYTSCYSKNHPFQKPQVMIRVIHQTTSLCKNSLFSECPNLIKGKLKKKTWPTITSFPVPFLAPSLHYRQALGQNALYASPQTCTISHSLKKHPGPGTGQALRFRHGCRSLPLGGLPGCLGLQGGEEPQSRDAQRQPESAGAARSAGKDKASQADEAAHTGHGAVQTRCLRTSAGGVRDDGGRKKRRPES